MITASEIARSLRGKPVSGGYICRCPVPGHGAGRGDRLPSLLVKEGDTAPLFKCFAGCSARDILVALGIGPSRQINPAPARRLSDTRASSDASRTLHALSWWDDATSLSGTLSERYLQEHRRLHVRALGDLSHALRWHPRRQCLTALMTDALTGLPTGVHRTFLNKDGSKLSRKMLGKQGVIRLSPDDAVTSGLGLSEGLEDGLAIMLQGWMPIWAATSSGALQRFPVLSGIEALTVFADADATGIEAANECVARWRNAGQEAAILAPWREAKDHV